MATLNLSSARVGTTARAGESTRLNEAAIPWPRLALGAIVLLSAFLSFFQLGAGGFANAYYAASVRSMLDSWHNFLFVAFDPGGFVTIDKPPVGFWLQAASAKLLGFSSFSILFPQALAGVLSVLVLYHLVRRHFGVVAGLLAALALAISPISVVTNRNNTIDSTLALILLLGAWAVLKAAESGKLRYLLLCAALIGIGFNVKMLEAYLVVPAYAALYLLAAPHRLPKRVGHLALASALLLAISLSWIAAVDLTPAARRPWVDSTQNNSEISLALGYNGIDRLLGMFHGQGAAGGLFGATNRANDTTSGSSTRSASGASTTATGSTSGTANPFASASGTNPFSGASSGAVGTFPGTSSGATAGFPGANGGSAAGTGQFGGPPGGGPSGFGGGMFGTGTPGPLRLFQQSLGGQIGWLLPLTVVGALALATRSGLRSFRGPRQQALILWGGWLLTMGAFFSVAGFFHPYYLTVMAPAVAALFGIGIVTLWGDFRRGGWKAWLLPLALSATAGEQVYLLSAYPSYARWLIPVLGAGVGFAVVALVAARANAAARSARLALVVGVAALALLIAPAVWGGIPVVHGEVQNLPSAGPSGFGDGHFGGGPGPDGGSTDAGLARYLVAHQGTATYLVAVPSSPEASSLILTTNQPVMALGGFSGSDPILTADGFAQLVQEGKIRYALVSSGGFGGPGGGQQSAITQWIEAHGTVVPASAWGGSTGGSFRGPGGGETLYQLSAV